MDQIFSCLYRRHYIIQCNQCFIARQYDTNDHNLLPIPVQATCESEDQEHPPYKFQEPAAKLGPYLVRSPHLQKPYTSLSQNSFQLLPKPIISKVASYKRRKKFKSLTKQKFHNIAPKKTILDYESHKQWYHYRQSWGTESQ